jgi:uncharacterized protein (DUF1697 family)
LRQIALLRGINLGSRNRIAMPTLREALGDAGYEDVETYVQSGNVVLSASEKGAALERSLERLIEDRFELTIPVVVRTRSQLAKVVANDPLADVVTEPKRYQVCFLRSRLKPAVVRMLHEATVEPEQVVVDGREIYSWHAEGVARSKLWAAVASKKLGVDGTARNWTTVTTLLEMAS